MAASENTDEDQDHPRAPRKGGPNSDSSDAITRALEAYQQGVAANNAEQVNAAAFDVLVAAAEETERHPTPQLKLQELARDCEARGDWAEAEACYHKVLALEEATGNSGLISKAHYDLSRFFLLIGDLEKADACAKAATAAARQCGVFPVLVMALEHQAICSLRRRDCAGALETASEAVRVVEPGRIHDGMRAGALVARARARMACGERTGAQSDLATSRPILLDQEISPIFAGRHSRAAGWWEVTAQGRTCEDDLEGACAAWEEAVQCRRHVASLGHVAGPHTLAALARSLRSLGEACDAAGKPEEGKAATAEARGIWYQLGLPERGFQ
jgi:tetratricopeptide (TPR) repeat protein